MRRLWLLIAVFCLLGAMPLSAEAYEVLILQSSRAPAYDEALRGVRSVRRFSERLLVLSDYQDIDLHRIVREDRPLLILALGDNAYLFARKIRQLPVVVLMAPNYRGNSGGHPALTGIELYLSPERYLAIFSSMRLKRVGMIGSLAKSGHYIRSVQQIAPRYGIEPVVREVTSPRDVTGQLASLRGEVDALWLLPDDTAVTRETADAYFLFSMEQQVPVVAFSAAYLQSGAAVAIEVNRFDIGRQAGEMLASLLEGNGIADHPPKLPRKSALKVNQTVLRRMKLSPEVVSKTWESR